MTVTEAEAVEVVEQSPPSDEKEAKRQAEAERSREIDVRQREAIDAAADAALAMPGSAGRDEFLAMAMQAKILSMSAAAPKAIKGQPHVALHIVMIGRDLGISPSAAVELIDVIDTQQGPRPSLSPQLLNGQIRRLGLGSIAQVVATDQRCVALAMGPGGRFDKRCSESYPHHWWMDDKYEHLPPESKRCTCTPDLWLGDSEFTWQDAQMAGLAGAHCTPGDHKKVKTDRGERCPCNFGYINYPKRMLWWRASGFCADDWFPEAGLGLYTAEELGALVDADGRAIDATAVEVPPGYEPTKGTPGYVEPPKEVTEDQLQERWTLQERVYALLGEDKDTLRERWKHLQRLKGQRLETLDVELIPLVTAMLRGIEQQRKTASKGEWDPDVALAAVREQEAAILARLLGCTVDIPAPAGDAEPIAKDEPAPEPAKRQDKRSRSESRANPDDQTQHLSRVVTRMSSHAAKLTEIIDAVTKYDETIVDNNLQARTLPRTGNLDTRKQRLVIAMCEQFLAEQTPTEQPTLDGTAPVEGE